MRSIKQRLCGVAAVAVLPAVLSACEAGVDAITVGTGVVEAADLAGVWTGEAVLSPAFAAPGEGERYSVSLVLDQGGWFTLRSDYPPVSADPQPIRRCDGVWTPRDGAIEFFPDHVCPALPMTLLSARGGGSWLNLEAFQMQPISVQLRMSLRRS